MFARLLVITGLLALTLSVVVHSSRGGGHEQVYRVKAYDTLWAIASAHYAGDPRAAIWKIERRNGIEDATISPGEKLILP